MTIVEHVTKQFGARPEFPILADSAGNTVSGAKLCDSIAALRCVLNDAGAQPGHRLGLVTTSSPRGVAAALTVLETCTLAPLDPGAPAPEIAQKIERLRLDALLVYRGESPEAESAAATAGIPAIVLDGFNQLAEIKGGRLKPGAAIPGPAALFLTSGTEGEPKVVPLTHDNLAASAGHIRDWMQLGTEDRFLCMARLHHIAGLGLVLASLAAGSAVFVAPGFYGAAFPDWLREWRPTWFWAAPATLKDAIVQIRKQPEALAGTPLRFIRVGSAPLAPAVLEEAEALFRVPVLETYGMTEAAPQITCSPLPPGARKAGSAGPAAGPEVRIAPETGEIEVRGPNVITAYESGPDGRFNGGWFRTGDIGHLDEDGYLFVTGRLKDLINRGGVKVSPRAVEEMLMQHPAVADAVVFPMAHASLGEDVAAVVAPRPGRDVEPLVLRSWLAARMSESYVPSRILIQYHIPKGAGGKVRRGELAASLAEAIGEVREVPIPVSRAPVTEAECKLAQIWKEILRVSQVGLDDEFFHLGGDSLALGLLWTKTVSAFQLRGIADRTEFMGAVTLKAQARVIEGRIRQRIPIQLHECLAPLQRRGKKAPLFIVPLAAESPEYYAALCNRLEAEHPVYSFCDPVSLEERGFFTVEQKAGMFTEAIRSVQPRGPYWLLGDCFGGTIAFEVAQQLQRAGEKVAGLMLFDSGAPGYPSILRHPHRWLVGGAQYGWRAIRHVGWRELGDSAQRIYRRTVLSWMERLSHHTGAVPGSVYRAATVHDGNVRAMNLYRPQAYQGEVYLLLSTKHHHTGTLMDRRLGWREAVKPTPGVKYLGGDRRSLFKEPGVEMLATAVREVMARGQR